MPSQVIDIDVAWNATLMPDELSDVILLYWLQRYHVATFQYHSCVHSFWSDLVSTKAGADQR